MIRRKGRSKFCSFQEEFGTASPGKFTRISLDEGDEVLIIAPGGGGFGSPLERSTNDVLEDILDRFISFKSAKECYGLGVQAEQGERKYSLYLPSIIIKILVFCIQP